MVPMSVLKLLYSCISSLLIRLHLCDPIRAYMSTRRGWLENCIKDALLGSIICCNAVTIAGGLVTLLLIFCVI